MINDTNVWAIYDKPRDFPDHVVARRFIVREGAAHPIATVDQRAAVSLDAARGLLPAGLTKRWWKGDGDTNVDALAKVQDDGRVVEVWW